MINKVKNAISKITNTVTNAVSSALDKLKEILENLINFAKKIVGTAMNEIVTDIMKVWDQIEEIREQAAAIGADVKECYGDNQQALSDLPKKTIAEMISCVTNEVNKAKKLIGSTINDIKLIGEEVLSLPGKLVHCVTGGHPFRCLISLLAEIVESIVAIPLRIASKVSQTIKLVAGIEGNIKTCAVKKVAQASAEAAAIGAKVAKCVADKIRE